MNCLLVTPDRVARDIVRTGLEQTESIDVDVATHATAAQQCREKDYALVVADTTLAEGADGIELLAAAGRARPEAELWLLSRSRSQGRLIQRERDELGIAECVTMPTTAPAFFAHLAAFLRRQRERRTA